MKTVRPVNLNALYEFGFDCTLLPKPDYDSLMSIIGLTTWVPDREGIFISKPDWSPHHDELDDPLKVEQERKKNAYNLHRAPIPLIRAVESLLSSAAILGDLLRAYSTELSYVSLYNGAEDLDWHWDGPSQADFFMLLYLNNSKGWPVQGGGELMTGVRSIDSNYLHVEPKSVSMVQSITPSSRTLVVCNNQNPRFVHKVNPLNEAKERIVLMIGFNLIATMKGSI